ncbi:MAG: hypothetical protein ACI4Q3_04385 [Kiritimatiellia bacterium]
MAMRFGAMALVVVAAALAGCRTTKEVLDDYERNISAGNYAAARPEVTELAEKEDDSQLLWRLLAGGAAYLVDDKQGAIRQFDAAEDVFRKNDQASVFSQGGQGALAMMTNDRSFPYDGGGVDRVFTCLYKAVDFMTLGRADEARVELNRAAQYQANWIYDRRRDVEAAARRMDADADAYCHAASAKQGVQSAGDRNQQANAVLSNADFAAQVREKCGYDPATSGNLETLAAADYMNAYALHVGGVFRWLNGDSDRNLLRDARTLAAANPAVARDSAEIAQGVRPRDQVWIWVEDGLCPAREEWRLDLPFLLIPGLNNYVLYAGMALPYLRARSQAAVSWRVRAGGAETPFAELADVDRLVKTEYDVYMRGALTREITRTVVKVGVQAALGAAAAHSMDRNHQLALRLAQLGVAAWAKTSTAADLRSWTSLPKTVKAVRIARPADGLVEVVADNHVYQIAVPLGNTMLFVRQPGPSAPPTVKQVTFQ